MATATRVRQAPRVAAPPRTLGYLPALDGLRAISVVAVLLYHGDVSWLPGGFLGVEVFFVITGYLITALLLAEWQRSTGHRPAAGFWLRRARRLLPALVRLLWPSSLYWVLFIPDECTSSAARCWPPSDLRHELVPDLLEAVVLRGRPAARRRFRHLWSLAVEEQFYLHLAAAVPRPARAGPGQATSGSCSASSLALVVASTVLMAMLYEPAPTPRRVYYGTDTRAPGC